MPKSFSGFICLLHYLLIWCCATCNQNPIRLFQHNNPIYKPRQRRHRGKGDNPLPVCVTVCVCVCNSGTHVQIDFKFCGIIQQFIWSAFAIVVLLLLQFFYFLFPSYPLSLSLSLFLCVCSVFFFLALLFSVFTLCVCPWVPGQACCLLELQTHRHIWECAGREGESDQNSGKGGSAAQYALPACLPATPRW